MGWCDSEEREAVLRLCSYLSQCDTTQGNECHRNNYEHRVQSERSRVLASNGLHRQGFQLRRSRPRGDFGCVVVGGANGA